VTQFYFKVSGVHTSANITATDLSMKSERSFPLALPTFFRLRQSATWPGFVLCTYSGGKLSALQIGISKLVITFLTCRYHTPTLI